MPAFENLTTETEDSVHLSPASMRKPLEDEQKSTNNEQLISFLNGVDANPYLDAFYGVLSQVLDTPYQRTFFNVLQHLREIHLLRHPSGIEYVWEALEKFVCRLKQLRSPNEAQELLIQLFYDRASSNAAGASASASVMNSLGCCCTCHGASIVGVPPSPPPLPPPQPVQQERKRSNCALSTNDHEPINADTSSRRPTFAEIISNATLKSASSTDSRRGSDSFVNNRSINEQSAGISIRTPPPPPPTNSMDEQSSSNGNGMKLLPQQILPQPKTKLKTFAWSKVPTSKIMENTNQSDNIWLKAARRFDTGALIKAINFDDLESLFAAQVQSPSNTMERNKNCDTLTPAATVSSNRLNSSGDYASTNSADANGTLGRRRDVSCDVNLLDPKRSLNVNIFLKQFRGGIEDLIELIETGDSHYLGLEKLRGLMKILPEPDELEALKAYTGDKGKLGNAERFFLAMSGMSNYRLRVESMLLKEEFLSMVDYMKPSINTLIAAARDLKNSQSLQEVLYLLLLVGNYLNAGGYGGNAAGFKMTSLWKLVEIRANKPNVTLLHYVVAEIEKRNTRLLDLPKELKHLDEASKLSFDTILSDFRHLKEKTERISKQVAQTNADDEIRHQTEVFFEFAKGELIVIERDIGQVDRLRLELATFFCEDTQQFKLEECFKILSTFSQRFARAIDENAERRLQEEKAELRRRLREQQKAKKEFTLNQRASFSETEPSRRLSDKYKSLLNPGDVLLPYHITDSPVSPAENGRNTNLMDVLTTSVSPTPSQRRSMGGDEQDDEFNVGPAFWRRSYNCKRRGTSSIIASTFNNRERTDPKPWRQRVEELLNENERPPNRAAHSASSGELDSICNARKQSQSEFNNPSSALGSNVDKPIECSPIFAKTFPRRENARIGSANDLDQYSQSTTTHDSMQRGPPVELKRSVWREQRRLRANSLLNEASENASSNDLNELLEIMKIENESNAAIRRRVSKLRLISGDQSGDEDSKPVFSPAASMDKTDIDEVVRHCEQARQEIDSMVQPMTSATSDPTPIQPLTTTEPESGKLEECSADFTLSASELPDCTSCNLVIQCRGDFPNSAASHSQESLNTVDDSRISNAPIQPHQPPLHEMLDEGFEEDGSNSTNCSSVTGVQSPPLLPASPKMRKPQQQRRPDEAKLVQKSRQPQSPMKSVSTTASQTRFSYQSGTKASTLKSSQQNSQSRIIESRPNTLGSRRSSLPNTTEPNTVFQARPVMVSVAPKAKVDVGMKNKKPASTTIGQARKPIGNGQPSPSIPRQQKLTLRPNTSKCSSPAMQHKTRIQAIPLRPAVQRLRTSASIGTSSSSGSDSEQKSSRNQQPLRKRFVPIMTRSASLREKTSARKLTPPIGNVSQQKPTASTVPTRPRLSSFRLLNTNKTP